MPRPTVVPCSRPVRPRAPRSGALLVSALALLPLGCASKAKPVDTSKLSKGSPRNAYDYLKTMIAANQHALEWASFSPGFKRRISEQAGRNVDVGDYTLARSTIASNSNKNMKLILESTYVSDKMLSADVAVVTIRSGKKQANPRFIRMTSYELTIRGEGEPVSEFIPSVADVLGVDQDGSVSMRIPTGESTGSFLKSIPPEKIKRFVLDDAWYLDDFGGVEDAMVEGIRGKAEPARPAGPPTFEPYPNAPPPATSPGGIGSPDAGPVGSPDGMGSPEGAPGGSPESQPTK